MNTETTIVHLARGHETVHEGGASVAYRPRRRYVVPVDVAEKWKGMGLLLPPQDVPDEPPGATDVEVAKMVKGATVSELEARAEAMGITSGMLTGTGRGGKVVEADLARAILSREAQAARDSSHRPSVPEVRTHGPARTLPAFPAALRMAFENDGAVHLYIRNDGKADVTLSIMRPTGETWEGTLPAGEFTVLPALPAAEWNAFTRGMECGVEFSDPSSVSVAVLRLASF